jgi:hypothetical protein
MAHDIRNIGASVRAWSVRHAQKLRPNSYPLTMASKPAAMVIR